VLFNNVIKLLRYTAFMMKDDGAETLITGPSPHSLKLLAKILPDIITGILKTACCQNSRIQTGGTRNKF
jgi:hypothetical protein